LLSYLKARLFYFPENGLVRSHATGLNEALPPNIKIAKNTNIRVLYIEITNGNFAVLRDTITEKYYTQEFSVHKKS